MNSTKKFFSKMAFFLGIAFSTAYGYHGRSYFCSNPDSLGSGFRVGYYGSFHIVFINLRDRVTVPLLLPNRSIERFDMIQAAPGGGGFISYGCTLCDRFVTAIRFDAIGLAESAEHAYFKGTSGNTVLHEAGLRWLFDLTFQPGFLIGKCVLAYFKVGGTFGGVREEAWLKDEFPPFDIIDKTTKCHYPGGYVLGAGANFLLMGRFSFFVENNWHSYTSHLSSLTNNLRISNATVDTRVTNLNSYSFSFGASVSF